MAAATETAAATMPAPANAPDRTTFHVGTRRSKLALWQTDRAAELLKLANPGHAFEIHPMATMGDKNQTTALHQFNAKSLWTHELEAQLVTGELDLIVHSLKDMPTQLPPDCALSAACDRTERRDSVIMSPRSLEKGYKTLADLPVGSVVGSSSVRRIAQLARLYPNLKTADVRGNVGTRLGKLDAEDSPFAALILAATGVQRVGEGARVTSYLTRTENGWYGPVGQGAIGIECRSSDTKVRAMCDAIIEGKSEGGDVNKGEAKTLGLHTWYECLAERNFLRTLEGGCSVPIGVDTVWTTGDQLTLYGIVLSVDGKQVVEGQRTIRVTNREEAEDCGLALAQELIEKGAGDILKEIVLNRKIIADGGGA